MNRFRWLAAGAVAAALLGVGAGVADEKDAVKKELKALEGNWQLVRQAERGALTPKSVVSRLRIVIEGSQISWYIGNPASNQDAEERQLE